MAKGKSQTASDNRQMTVEEWARIQARALVEAGKQAAGGAGAADVVMMHAAKLLIVLIEGVEIAGQDLPGYGSGWLELLGDFVTDRLASDR